MTKSQVWAEVQKILEGTKVSKAKMEELSVLLAPKAGGRANPTLVIDDIEYYYCRYTGKFWPLENMICQNDEKRQLGITKGYSKVGISLWTKGQKYYKDLKDKLTIAILEGNTDDEVIAELRDIKDKTNTIEWLGQFATEEQQEAIDMAVEGEA